MNPCKECIIKTMCNDPCDKLVICIIRRTDSTKIKMDLLDFSIWKAKLLRNELPELLNDYDSM